MCVWFCIRIERRNILIRATSDCGGIWHASTLLVSFLILTWFIFRWYSRLGVCQMVKRISLSVRRVEVRFLTNYVWNCISNYLVNNYRRAYVSVQFGGLFYVLGVQFLIILLMSINRWSSIKYPLKYKKVRFYNILTSTFCSSGWEQSLRSCCF